MKRAVAAALILTATAGVAFAKSQARVNPVACPAINVLEEATRLTQMDAGRIDLKAEIREPELACTIAGGTAKAQLSFWVKGAIAPAANVAARNVPYFVAIILNGDIVAKEVFDLKLAFEGDKRMLSVKERVTRIDIPIAQGKTAEDYSVTIGFQLTQEQADYNRTASR